MSLFFLQCCTSDEEKQLLALQTWAALNFNDWYLKKIEHGYNSKSQVISYVFPAFLMHSVYSMGLFSYLSGLMCSKKAHLTFCTLKLPSLTTVQLSRPNYLELHSCSFWVCPGGSGLEYAQLANIGFKQL